MICNMGTGGKKCPTEVHLKANLREVARMAMVCTDGLIRLCTKASGSREKLTDAELTSGQMGADTTVSGARTSCMGKESTNGQMVESIPVPTSWTRSTALACTNGLTENDMKDSGLTASNTDKESSPTRRVKAVLVSGKKVHESNGFQALSKNWTCMPIIPS